MFKTLIYYFIFCNIIRTTLGTEYWIKGSECKIPKQIPSPVDKFFQRLDPLICGYQRGPLSTVIYNKDRTKAQLVIFTHRYNNYTLQDNTTVYCRYSNLLEESGKPVPPITYIYTPVVDLAPDLKFIAVFCKQSVLNLEIYRNVHAIILITPDIKEKISRVERKKPENNLGLILLQLDSMSLSNFRRAMPSVNNYLEQTGWFHLEGHHKVAVNTYPNENAILTGVFANTYEDERRVWTDFNANNYITSYAEDIFGPGFKFYKNQTDYSGYPLRLFLGTLPGVKTFTNYESCNGQFSGFDRTMDQLIEFARVFSGDRHMGFFVNSAMTHDDVRGPSAVEVSLLRYLKRLERLGITNDSIFLMYGDHGLRFGPQKTTFEGAREDSMPMLWISLPQWFQEKHKDIGGSLITNKNRLTSHFDLHHTLKHIIELMGGVTTPINTTFCPECQSLFKRVREDRNCFSAGIPYTYCFCNIPETTDEEILRKAKEKVLGQVVEHMNSILVKAKRNGHRCLSIENPSLKNAWKKENTWTVVFSANVPRVFEATYRGSKVLDVKNVKLIKENYLCSKCPREYREYCLIISKHAPNSTGSTKGFVTVQLMYVMAGVSLYFGY